MSLYENSNDYGSEVRHVQKFVPSLLLSKLEHQHILTYTRWHSSLINEYI